MNAVISLFSYSLILFAVLTLLPALIAFSAQENGNSINYIMCAALSLFLGGALALILRFDQTRLRRVGSFWLLLLVWVVLAGIAAIPIAMQTELSFVSAYFEAMSGLTTTGSTLFNQLDTLPRSLIFWRAELQWIGGLLTIVGIVMILAPSGAGGLPDRNIRLMEHADTSDAKRIFDGAKEISLIYLSATAIIFLGLIVAGINGFDALCLTFSSLSTGGFMPRDGALDVYQNPLSDFVLVLGMLIGGTSVLWHRMVLQRRWQAVRDHREGFYILGVSLGLGFIMAVILFQAAGSASVLHPLTALREGVVQAVSLITTTGFESRDAGLTLLPLGIVLIIALIGGSTFSTSGGIKFYRVGGMFVQGTRELRRLLYPHGIRASSFGSQPYDIQLMKAIWSFFVIALVATLLGAILIASVSDQSLASAILASASNLANIGQLYASNWPESGKWVAYKDMPTSAHVVLMSLMVLGRIEILAFFGMLNRTFWKS